MVDSKTSEAELLKAFFASPVAQKGTQPLKNGVEIVIQVSEHPTMILTKKKGVVTITEGNSKSPDMTFWIGKKGVRELSQVKTEDVGEMGVAIIKLMLSRDADIQLKSKVHIGSLQLLTHGYLAVLPLGGSTVMKFLASKGFSNLGKIKEAISQLRG